MKRRAGFTLLELLVVLTLLAFILPMAGWMTYVLLRAQTARANSLAEGVALEQFSRAFRADVHASRTAELPRDKSRVGEKLVLHLEPLQTVTYSIARDGAIVRRVNHGGKIDRSEQFRLVQRQSHFEISKDGKEVIACPEQREGAQLPSARSQFAMRGPAVLFIGAVIGRDHRFESSPRASADATERGAKSP